jgi:hypothetical protein
MKYMALAGMVLTGSLLLGGWRLVAAQAQAQEEISADPDVMPNLTIELGSGPNLGGNASGGLLLERDGWNYLTLYAGDTRSRSLCVGGMSVGAKGATSGVPSDHQPLVVWTVWARLVGFDGDAATMDVRWRREPRSDDLQPAGAYEGQLRWTAAEGVSTVLDLVRQVNPGAPWCESRSITMRFAPFSTPALRHAAIAYDLWLVQRVAQGGTVTHHMRTTGQQGEHVSFFFPEVAIDVPSLRNPSGPAILDMSVRGHIRGRIKRDGRVDISVEAGRAVGLRGLGLFSGTTGRSRLTVAPGETVEFEPVPMQGGWETVRYADVFRETPTAIRVRATRLW